ncbi:prolyl aminopeptidase [Nocardiopsis rhodophaea]|uniref:Proline iminopeptidase n=1 Tax=Nocardiopsis rhodophaea TaxID=280238 RepID=A0ABN2TKR6_9ACTN
MTAPAAAPPTRRSGWLPVGGGHVLRWWESGAPGGVPLLLLHGGPGGHSTRAHRALADPRRFRVIQVDQRGCGASRPRGELAANTTDHLVDDLERLRAHLGVEGWVVLGPSWGAVLALALAARYPRAVRALVLSGVFLGAREEYRPLLDGRGVDAAVWDRFVAPLDAAERADVPAAYARRIHDPAHPDHMTAVRNWLAFDAAQGGAAFAPSRIRAGPGLVASVAVEAHYARHRFFLPAEGVLGRAGAVAAPVTVVQGTGDTAGAASARRLCAELPHARLRWVEAGHSALEPRLAKRIRASLAGVAAAVTGGAVAR